MIEKLKKAVNLGDGQYIDACIEEQSTLEIIYIGDKLDDVNTTSLTGGRVAALCNGGYAASSFTDVDKVEDAVRNTASSAAKISKFDSAGTLAPVPVVKDRITPEPGTDPRDIILRS